MGWPGYLSLLLDLALALSARPGGSGPR